MRHPDALDQDQTLAIPESGATVSITLWGRQRDVVPLRPIYPGACLVDARLLAVGQVAMLVSLPAQPGASDGTRELWQLDASTGQPPSRVTSPPVQTPVATMVLEPLLGIAVVALTLKVPGLMGGGAAGGNIVSSLLGTAAGSAVGAGVGVGVRAARGGGPRVVARGFP